jgi:hypothetical protein
MAEETRQESNRVATQVEKRRTELALGLALPILSSWTRILLEEGLTREPLSQAGYIHYPRSDSGCGTSSPLSIFIVSKGKPMVLFQ